MPPFGLMEAFLNLKEVTDLSIWKRTELWCCLLGIALGISNILWQPCLFVRAQGKLVTVTVAMPGEPFSLRFIHSVQKTPVVENLAIANDGQGVVLHSTKYQSFGVGLPFLESEGNFHEEGDFFIFDNMERYFPKLDLRTGVGTKLTLIMNGREYRLYEEYPPGTMINIYIQPFLRGVWQ